MNKDELNVINLKKGKKKKKIIKIKKENKNNDNKFGKSVKLENLYQYHSGCAFHKYVNAHRKECSAAGKDNLLGKGFRDDVYVAHCNICDCDNPSHSTDGHNLWRNNKTTYGGFSNPRCSINSWNDLNRNNRVYMIICARIGFRLNDHLPAKCM